MAWALREVTRGEGLRSIPPPPPAEVAAVVRRTALVFATHKWTPAIAAGVEPFIASALAALHGQALVAVLAHSLVLFLVLLPYVAFRQVGAVLGPGELNRIFFKPRA